MFMETAAQVVVIDASGKQTLVVCSIFHWSNVTGWFFNMPIIFVLNCVNAKTRWGYMFRAFCLKVQNLVCLGCTSPKQLPERHELLLFPLQPVGLLFVVRLWTNNATLNPGLVGATWYLVLMFIDKVKVHGKYGEKILERFYLNEKFCMRWYSNRLLYVNKSEWVIGLHNEISVTSKPTNSSMLTRDMLSSRSQTPRHQWLPLLLCWAWKPSIRCYNYY